MYKHCWPLRFDLTANCQSFSSLATASARQCCTCYGRDGTITSGSINRENDRESPCISKRSNCPRITEKIRIYTGAKENERQWKTWTRTCTTFLHKKWKQGSFWTFHVVGGSQWGGGIYGYRLKSWLFYGYRLIFFQLRLTKELKINCFSFKKLNIN